MVIEVELKFQIDESAIDDLLSFLRSQTHSKAQVLKLTNRYFDTCDNLLREKGLSVRIRGIEEVGGQESHEITAKSSGQTVAGLHVRKEFNAQLPDRNLDLSLLPAELFGDNLDIATLSQQLTVLFTTDFERKTWLIDYKQSQIEVALDVGCILASQSSSPILELELELKSGDQRDLLLFAVQLTQFNLHLVSQSKAARGYRLLQGEHSNQKVMLSKFDELSLSNLLGFWQTNEEYALASDDKAGYQQTLHLLSEPFNHLISAPNPYSTELNELYNDWNRQRRAMIDIKKFAFCEINTKFKLYLILLSLNN